MLPQYSVLLCALFIVSSNSHAYEAEAKEIRQSLSTKSYRELPDIERGKSNQAEKHESGLRNSEGKDSYHGSSDQAITVGEKYSQQNINDKQLLRTQSTNSAPSYGTCSCGKAQNRAHIQTPTGYGSRPMGSVFNEPVSRPHNDDCGCGEEEKERAQPIQPPPPLPRPPPPPPPPSPPPETTQDDDENINGPLI